MAREFRLDVGALRKPQKMPNGFLRVDGNAARVGVQEYPRPDGTIRRELRLPEEVMAPKSIASYEGASVTDQHPRGPVTAENARRLEVGTVTTARQDGDWVVVSTMIKDPVAIKKIESGATGLSVGYTVNLDETPGVHPLYGRYDAVQRDIEVNHVASAVERPRAGDIARLRMDDGAFSGLLMNDDESTSFENEWSNRLDSTPSPMAQGDRMADPDKSQQTIATLGTSLKVAETRADAAETSVKNLTLERDTARGQIKVLETQIGELRSQIAAGATAVESDAISRERVRADAAEATIRRFDETVAAQVRERVMLERDAAAVLGESTRLDDMTPRQVRVAAIKRLDATADVGNEVPDGVITGMFMSLLKRHSESARTQARIAEVMRADNGGGGTHVGREDDDREKKRNNFRNQGLAPLPNSNLARKDA